MSRDLTCNETMSVIDDAEAKDQRFFQGQSAVSSRVPITPAVTAQISRPVLKTLRGQPASHIINSPSGMSQKAHLLNTVVNAQIQSSTSQFNRTSTSKLISTRTSPSVPSNTIFKPFHSSVDNSVIVSDELSQPMAVIYRQFQQQQQLQQQQQQQQQLRLTVNQSHSAFSFPRSRDYEQRAHGNATQTVSQDARYFNSLNRLRPIVSSRSSNSSQQVLSVPAVANTLRLAPQTRTFIDMMEATEPCRNSSRLINVADAVGSHESDINVGLSTRDKQMVSSSVCFSTPNASCDPSTSSVSNVLSAAATSSTCASSQISNAHASPHPGPSPRPSILRKIRDPSSSGPSAAVRRLTFDGPPSRPSSCSDSQIFSSSLNEDTSSPLARYIMSNSGRASSFIPQIDSNSRVLSSSDPNVRNVQSNPFTSATTMSKSVFESVESSPQQVNEPDTPRKRMRKQQFDSTQGPEKIKMEVSMQLDANNIDMQKNEIPLWKLAPPGQPASSTPPSKGNEKGGRRRGRPRTSSRVDSSVIASTSYVDVDTVPTEGCKPKKIRKHQSHANTSESNLSENINPVTNSSAIEMSSLKPSFPSGIANICDAGNNGSAVTSLRNLLQTLQNNRDESAKFLDSQKNVGVVLPVAPGSGMTKVETKIGSVTESVLKVDVPENNRNKMECDTISRVEGIREPLSLDASEYISSLSPIELGYSSPTILASLVNSSKHESVSSNGQYLNSICSGSTGQFRPHLRLNTLGNSKKVRFNHFDKIESVKLASQRVAVLKAARDRLREREQLEMECKIKERMQLKAFLLEKCKQRLKAQRQPNFLQEECLSFKKLSDITSEALESSTAELFDELVDVFGKQPEFLLMCRSGGASGTGDSEDLSSVNVSVIKSGEGMAEDKLSAGLKKSSEVVGSSCAQRNKLLRTSFGSVKSAHTSFEPRNWKTEIAAIADLLDEMVTKVVESVWLQKSYFTAAPAPSVTSGNQSILCGNNDRLIQGKVSSSNSVNNSMNNQLKSEVSEEVIGSNNQNWYSSDELWDDYIRKELEKVEEALKLLERDDELADEDERGLSKLAFRRIITTFDALRRAEVNENEDIFELLYLLLDFVKLLDPKSYEQLLEGFELLYDANDSKELREKKRLNLVETFAVQIPRAHSTLKKATPYIASASTNFKPSLTLIDELFEIKHLPERKSWSNIDKSSFAINYKMENGKEIPLFKRYSGDFNIDAELDGTEPNYLPSLLKDHYERETGSLAFRLRLEPRSDEKLSQNAAFSEADDSFTTESHEICAPKENHEFSLTGSAHQQKTSNLSYHLNVGDELLSTRSCNNDTRRAPEQYCTTSGDKKWTNSRLKNLTNADYAHIRSRMRNIREQYASLLQTLHTNAMLASTAYEIFNDYSDELLADILPSARTVESDASDVNSEHSTNDEDIRESVETPVSLSLPPSP